MMQAACCCVCLLFLLGPIFFIVGVSYVADSTTDSRGEGLKELQGYAAAWEDGHRADFEELDLAVAIGSGLWSDQTTLPAVTTGDSIPDIGSQPDDIDITWTPLRYSARVDAPGSGYGPPGDTYRLYVGGVEVDQAGPFALCEQQNIAVSNCQATCSSNRRRSSSQQCTSSCCPCSVRCQESGGTYEADRYGTMHCKVTLQLQEVCFVAPSGAGAGGASADPTLWTGQTTGFADSLPEGNDQVEPPHEPKVHTSAGTYARVPVGQFCPQDSNFEVRVTVRSSDDPYLLAAMSTDYSFDFGNTQAENAKAGGAFIVLGLIFCIIPVCAGYAIYSCAQQRKRSPVNPQPQVVMQQVRATRHLLQHPPLCGCKCVRCVQRKRGLLTYVCGLFWFCA
jgi:hypothetical protein